LMHDVNKKPPRSLAGAMSAWTIATSDLFRRHVAAQDVAERLPLLALEALHLQLADRGEVVRSGVDLDAGQQGVRREVLQARGLLHQIGAGEIVAALFQRLDQRLRGTIAVDDAG